ncbi:membrane protein [Actibacterium mucosum KCTC 23349]|uniref:Membrane protein n=1 Tax=Actibacterium mucosum KCTC 23349 TaxID=1454373 RepID=A0A037ZIC2_9RHOB|nr:DMT family transporter [Actibacterium mucosum]KAJ55354.1 membrane protein [Actibacterium mucosum KCTC 23349]
MTNLPPRNNLAGGAWLIADMSLNIWALSIVKAMGADIPAAQVVFLRASVGLILILPWILRSRAQFAQIEHLPLQLARVALSSITLTASFFAIARMPLALFTAIGFTRPMVTMLMAALFLRETILGRHWIAALVALIGVLVAVRPSELTVPALALAAQVLVVVTSSAVVILTRRLRAAPPVVMMAFYTGGLALCTAGPAAWSWQPLTGGTLLPLLAVGVFAQAAQFCFLRAQFWGDAAVLSVLSYLSMVFSGAIGFFIFGEVLKPHVLLGAALVIGAALSLTLSRPSKPRAGIR